MAGDLSKLIRKIYVRKGTSRLYWRACSIKDIYKPLLSLRHLCQGFLMLIKDKFNCKLAQMPPTAIADSRHVTCVDCLHHEHLFLPVWFMKLSMKACEDFK